MTPAEPAEFSLQIRDLLLGLSLLISSASLLLHWYRGRKVVVMEFEEPSIPSKITSKHQGGGNWKPPTYQRWVEAPLLVHNETRHAVRVVGIKWQIPRRMTKGIDVNATQIDPNIQVVSPENTSTLVFKASPDWKVLGEALRTPLAGKSSASSMSDTRESIIITLSLNIQSKAFWWRTTKMTKVIEIKESTIKHAIRDQ